MSFLNVSTSFPTQQLCLEYSDDDPDDAFSSVPYEKGFNLLYSLEKIVGVDAFAVFMKAYFNHFKFGVVTSHTFRKFFESHFKDIDGISSFDWDTWLHKPGMPETPNFDRTLSAECEGLADAWIYCDETNGVVPTKDIVKWSTGQKTCFLDAILSKCEARGRPMSILTIGLMEEAYGMHESQNSEILFRFCMIAVAAGDTAIFPIVLRFITSQGRMKFVRPLYRALFNSVKGKDVAIATFLENKDFYHPIAAKMLATDLGVAMGQKEKSNMSSSSSSSKSSGDGGKLQKSLLVGSALVLAAAIGVAFFRGKRN